MLDSESIYLWCAFYDEIRDEVLLREYEHLLSESERQRRSRFAFADDRHRFLVTRALLRTVLSEYVPSVGPADWIFAPNVHGRPEIVNDHPAARHVSFNISHTKSLVVLALTYSRALGVDTENVTRAVPLEIADRYFAPAEVTSLHALPPVARQRRFLEYWTLKESYIKARAMGLSIPLDTFSFEFVGKRRVMLRIDDEQPAAATSWLLRQWSVRGDYLIALCANRGRSGVTRFLMKESVPLLVEHDIVVKELRASA